MKVISWKVKTNINGEDYIIEKDEDGKFLVNSDDNYNDEVKDRIRSIDLYFRGMQSQVQSLIDEAFNNKPNIEILSYTITFENSRFKKIAFNKEDGSIELFNERGESIIIRRNAYEVLQKSENKNAFSQIIEFDKLLMESPFKIDEIPTKVEETPTKKEMQAKVDEIPNQTYNDRIAFRAYIEEHLSIIGKDKWDADCDEILKYAKGIIKGGERIFVIKVDGKTKRFKMETMEDGTISYVECSENSIDYNR